MDCFRFLKKINDESIELAIIDPPYNMKKSEWDTFNTQEEFLDFSYKWIQLVIAKLKKNGSIYIFNTPYNSSYFLQLLVDEGMHFQNWITWDKRDGMGGAKRKFSPRQETILFFTKNNQHTFNYNDIRVPYESTERIAHAAKKGILKNGRRWFPNPNGRLCSDVWHFSSHRHNKKINGKVVKHKHLTPKPEALIERMVLASSNQGDTILDCFIGSGTTAVVAKKHGRNFIGCDNNEQYVKFARERVTNIKQMALDM